MLKLNLTPHRPRSLYPRLLPAMPEGQCLTLIASLRTIIPPPLNRDKDRQEGTRPPFATLKSACISRPDTKLNPPTNLLLEVCYVISIVGKQLHPPPVLNPEELLICKEVPNIHPPLKAQAFSSTNDITRPSLHAHPGVQAISFPLTFYTLMVTLLKPADPPQILPTDYPSVLKVFTSEKERPPTSPVHRSCVLHI